MIGNISDMTAAAVVVSAMDGSSKGMLQKNAQPKAQDTGIQVDLSQQQAELPQVNAAQGAEDTDNNDKDQQGKEKGQMLDNINEKFVSEMTKELNELMSKLNCDLEFQYHNEVGIMSVKMVDKHTKEVIKEYPPEEMVEGMIKAQEWLGAFLDKNA